MTDILLHPAAVSGIARVPASKSYVHRLMIVSALSGHRLTIKGSPKSKDIEATANCLKALGAKVAIGESSIEIVPPARFKPALLDAAESGSTLRMLLPVIPVLGVEATFTGRGRLPQRPVSDVVGVLKKAGARVEGESLPIKVGGGYATKIFEIENPVSSQHVSGILTALAALGGGSITVKGKLPSEGYVSMTAEVLRLYGVDVVKTDAGYEVGSGFTEFPAEAEAETDWSGAAFMAAIGAVAGKVSVPAAKYPSLQPDSVCAEILKRAGAKVEITETGIVFSKGEKLEAFSFDADSSPDLVPAMAAAAAFADGVSVIRGVDRLRLKESDRIASVVGMLDATGIEARYSDNAIYIRGGTVRGGTVDAKNDHRIAMAAAVLATGADGAVKIIGAECVDKSFAGFFDEYVKIGGKAEWVK